MMKHCFLYIFLSFLIQLIRSQKQVYAVMTGGIVTFSSSFDSNHIHYMLDYNGAGPQSWSARQNKVGQWIQVSLLSAPAKIWTAAVIQGRGDFDQWVRSVKIAHSLDGKTWQFLENGKVFQGTEERDAKVRINFDQTVIARIIRIYPQTWLNHISMRFDAIYLDG